MLRRSSQLTRLQMRRHLAQVPQQVRSSYQGVTDLASRGAPSLGHTAECTRAGNCGASMARSLTIRARMVAEAATPSTSTSRPDTETEDDGEPDADGDVEMETTISHDQDMDEDLPPPPSLPHGRRTVGIVADSP